MKRRIVQALENAEPSVAANVEAPKTTKSPENEIVLFAKIGDPEGFHHADEKEHHVQLEGAFTTGPRARVRETIKDDKTNYVFTIKVKQPPKEGGELVSACVEDNTVVDKNFFETYKQVAERQIDKTRYTFHSDLVQLTLKTANDVSTTVEIPQIKYEVDVFDNDPEWCKIDIEVNVILDFLAKDYPDIKEIKLNLKVSHLPFKPTDVIIAASQSDEERVQVDALWKKWTQILNKPKE